MKFSTFLFAIMMLLGFGCSSTDFGQRDPASVQQEKETCHEKFQGTFDKQN